MQRGMKSMDFIPRIFFNNYSKGMPREALIRLNLDFPFHCHFSGSSIENQIIGTR